MSVGGGESGQASVEWVGLVLLVALVLAAVGWSARGGGGRSALAETVAGRLTAAAKVAGAGARGLGASGSGAPAVGAPRAGPPGAGPSGGHGPPFLPPAPPGPRGPVPSRDAPRAPTASLGREAIKAVDHAWLICLGYRRFRYDAEHPRPPNDPFPLDAALEIANECFNPWAIAF